MGVPFDYAPDRPEHIDTILNGLNRYNPETTAVFQDYVMQQCENQTYDCYANLALLKLYVDSTVRFSPGLSPFSYFRTVMIQSHIILRAPGLESLQPAEAYLLALSESFYISPRLSPSSIHKHRFAS